MELGWWTEGGTDGRWRRVPPFSTAAFPLSSSSSFTPTQNSSRRNVRGDSLGSYFFPADSSFPECAKVSLYSFLLLVRRHHLSLFFFREAARHSLTHSLPPFFREKKDRYSEPFPSRLPPPPALAKAKARLKASLGCTHRHFPPPLIDFFRATTNSGLKPPPSPFSLVYCGSSGGRRSPSTTIAFTAKALSLSLYLSQPSFTSCSSFSLPTTTTLRINKTRRWSGGAARSSSSSPSSSSSSTLASPAPLPQVTSMQVEGGREGCAFVLLLLLLRQRERGKKGGDTPFFQPLSLLSRGCCLARSV